MMIYSGSAGPTRADSAVPPTIHDAAVYGSDDEFLAMAVPFARGAIAAREPVLAATTPANLELLTSALGEDAAHLDLAETVYFGPRPPQRVTAFEKYARQRGDGGRVRILAEPFWAGRTAAEISDWQRMEASLNVLLAGTGIWIICPYDTRQLPEAVVTSARRTHPALVDGTGTRPSPGYADPASYAASLDSPLPPVPGGAALLPATIRLRDIRRFASSQAAGHLAPGSASLMTVAIHETAAYLKNATGSPVATRIWQQPGAIACDLRADGPAALGTFDGFQMPDPSQPRPDDGLWYARQFTTRLDLRATASGIQARLQLRGARILDGA
jgi:hypothetical protein